MNLMRLSSAFYLILVLLSNTVAMAQNSAPCNGSDDESNTWSAIKDTVDPLILKSHYLDKYPDGCNRRWAILKFNSLVPASISTRLSLKWGSDGISTPIDAASDVQNRATSFLSMETLFDVSKFRVQYVCFATGRPDPEGWYDIGQPCPASSNPTTALVGFGVKGAGLWAELFDVVATCTTVGLNNSSPRSYSSSPQNGYWCGEHYGSGARWVKELRISISRKVLN